MQAMFTGTKLNQLDRPDVIVNNQCLRHAYNVQRKYKFTQNKKTQPSGKL